MDYEKGLDACSIIETIEKTKPRKLFVMDKATLYEAKQTVDANGIHLWCPYPNYPDMHGTFMGIQIEIVEEICFKLHYMFAGRIVWTIEFAV